MDSHIHIAIACIGLAVVAAFVTWALDLSSASADEPTDDDDHPPSEVRLTGNSWGGLSLGIANVWLR